MGEALECQQRPRRRIDVWPLRRLVAYRRERVIVLPKQCHRVSQRTFVQLVSEGFRRYGLLLFVMQLPDRIAMIEKGVFFHTHR